MNSFREICRGCKRIKVGDPLSEETDMGALVSKSHLETVNRYVEIGTSEGAKLAYGGKSRESSRRKLL